ncbi:uncharacterized protein LOC142338213 isoform X1 [Convolutriloba macropyga]|uniref:uncharacterized protein LOC142338213 isoform X1 n=1 Tax=Convolutriloba macropyga TaxID=536237 RepID=UPI003F524D1D
MKFGIRSGSGSDSSFFSSSSSSHSHHRHNDGAMMAGGMMMGYMLSKQQQQEQQQQQQQHEALVMGGNPNMQYPQGSPSDQSKDGNHKVRSGETPQNQQESSPVDANPLPYPVQGQHPTQTDKNRPGSNQQSGEKEKTKVKPIPTHHSTPLASSNSDRTSQKGDKNRSAGQEEVQDKSGDSVKKRRSCCNFGRK